MRLKHTQQDAASEPRYDGGTLRKVAALATRLQSRHQETLTAREMEAIGAEVALEPAFIRQALAQLTTERPRINSLTAKIIIGCWWGTGWSLPLLAATLANALGANTDPVMFASFLGGMFLYVVPGTILSFVLSDQSRQARTRVSRATLLQMLFTLQRELEGQKQHRAFLSVDVVSSSEMKRDAPELAVEHSFGQFRDWVEEIVQGDGGEMQSTAGDGVMCVFPTDAGAVRAARRLQEELPQFNALQNRLSVPFRIRCGVTAGEVAIEDGIPLGHLQSPVIDRAAALQKRAEPGNILVGREVADAARVELGNLAPFSEPVAGEPAFSWRAGHQTSSSA